MRARTRMIFSYLKAFNAKLIIVSRYFLEEIYTLLTFHNNLRPYFKLINFIYEIHNEIVVPKWLKEEPWLCCVR